MSSEKLNMGLMVSFRNPAQWRKPFAEAYQDELDTIVLAEKLGFDTIWLTEHHFVDDGYLPSVTTVAAAIAARTERIRIGFNLIVLPLHNPLRLAEDIASLDVLSNGRIDLGVGQGFRKREYEGFGYSRTERKGRFIEGLDILTGLLSNDTFSYEGKYNKVVEARLRPPAVQQPMPPLWIGAMAPPSLQRAGERGAHLLGVGSPELQDIYEQALSDAGHDVAASKVLMQQWVHIADTDDQAWQQAAPHFHHELTVAQAWQEPGTPMYDVEIPPVEGMQEKSKYLPLPHVFGSPETVSKRLESAVGGIRTTHLTLHILAGMDPAITNRSLTRFAQEIMPSLRAAKSPK